MMRGITLYKTDNHVTGDEEVPMTLLLFGKCGDYDLINLLSIF